MAIKFTISKEDYYESLKKWINKTEGPDVFQGVVKIMNIEHKKKKVGHIYYYYEGNKSPGRDLYEIKVFESLRPFGGYSRHSIFFTKDSAEDKEWALLNSPHEAAEILWRERINEEK